MSLMVKPGLRLIVVATWLGVGCTVRRRPTVRGADRPAVAQWRLSRSDEVSIGTDAGPAPYELTDVVGAFRFADGSIVVADAPSRQIRRYSRTGKFVAAWGRKGEGPGEFKGLNQIVRWPGGGVGAIDESRGRVSVFSETGRLEGSWRIGWLGFGLATVLSASADSSLLVTVANSDVWRHPPPAYGRDTAVLARIPPLPRGPEILLSFVLGDVYTARERLPGPGGMVGWESFAVPRPFGRAVEAAANGDLYVFQLNDAPEIVPRAGDRQLATLGWSLRPRAIDRADIVRFVDHYLAKSEPSDRPYLRKIFDGLHARATAPAFGPVRLSMAGRVWVERFCLPGSTSCTWDILLPGGEKDATIEIPADMAICDISFDHVVTVTTDSNDAPCVHVLRIVRPEAVHRR